jgi:hypothetical protein
MAREGVPLVVIQRQLGHSNLGITSVYLQGIDNAEIIETVHARRAPMVPVTTSRPDLPGTSHRGQRVREPACHARGRAPAHSSADAAHRQSQSSSHAEAQAAEDDPAPERWLRAAVHEGLRLKRPAPSSRSGPGRRAHRDANVHASRDSAASLWRECRVSSEGAVSHGSSCPPESAGLGAKEMRPPA